MNLVPWQQTLVPSLVFYGLASLVAFGVAGLIAGLASLLGRMEAAGKDKAQ
jgi:hypothetical protein